MARQAEIEIVLSDGRKAGNTLKDLQSQANQLNNNIKKLEIGSAEWEKKTKDFQKVSGRLRDVRSEVKGVSDNQKLLNSQMLQFLPFGPQIQRIAGNFRLVNGAVGGTTKGMNALKIAIAGTGIGLLVIALGSLVTYLRSTQEGMDKVNSVLRPLSALFQRSIGLIQELGGKAFKSLGDFIKDPIQGFKDFGTAIQENVMRRLEAFSKFAPAIRKIFSKDWKEGLQDLADATIQLGTGIEGGIDKMANAAESTVLWVNQGIEAGNRIFELQKRIEQTEIQLVTARAKLNAEYQKSKEIAQDQSLADDERLKAAQDAQRAQNQLLDIEQRFLDLKIEKMKEEHALNDTSRADKLELANLEAERTNFEAQAARKRASAKALENQVDREIAAEQKKSDKEVFDNKDQLRQQELETQKQIQDLAILAMEEGLEREIAQLQIETERKIEVLAGSEAQIAEQKALLLEISEKQQQQIRDKYTAESKSKRKKSDEEELADIRLKEDAKRQIQDASYAAFNDSINAGIELLSKDEQSRKKHANVIKAFEAARVAVGLQAELQAIWEYANKNPANALFPGAANIIAVVKTIAAVGRATAAASKINSQKFALGGVLRGPSHQSGGIPIEAEGDEIILTKGVYQNPMGRLLASELNYAFGGVRFMQSGGPVNPLAQSANPPSTSEINSTSILSMDTVVAAINALGAKIDTYHTNLKVINVVSETRDGIKTINNLEQDAGF